MGDLGGCESILRSLRFRWSFAIMTLESSLALTRVHSSLRGRTNGNRFFEVTLTCPRDPGNFWRETLDVVLFPLEDLARDEHWKIGVLDTEQFDLCIEPGSYDT